LSEEQQGGEMSLLEHLQELRQRVFIMAIGITIGTILGFWLAAPLINFLKAAAPEGSKIIATEVTEKFTTLLAVGFKLGIVFSLPVLMYHVIRFVAPGLTSSEKRYLYALLPAIFFFFGLGAAFAYFLMVPFAISYLIGFSDIAEQQTRISNFVDFVLNLVFWVGISFETPLIIWFLCKIKVLTPQRLSGMRRYAVVLAFVVGAIITPTPDPINQTIVSVPIYLLFELGIIFARIFK
jgi:sec-independent protein translocase protein TatC